MPAYVLICSECEGTLPELVCSIAEREAMRCPDCGAGLTNDYLRQGTSNFQLKGGGWPGKAVKMENDIVRERDS